MKFKNEQKISKIMLKGRSHNFCPLGQAHYTNNFTVEFVPNQFICDYCDVERFIKEEINDKALIIEDCVKKLFNYFIDEYNPQHLIVKSLVSDATHPEVEVTKCLNE